MATAAKHNKKDNKNKDKSKKKPKVDQEKVSAGLSKFSDVCGRANDVMDLINQLAEIAGIPGLPLDSIPVDLIPTNIPDREHLINPKAILLLTRLQSTYNPAKGKYPKMAKLKLTMEMNILMKLLCPRLCGRSCIKRFIQRKYRISISILNIR